MKANLSKAALARRVGVSDVTISYWESGTIKQIGHERLVALAEALDCNLSDLLQGTPATQIPYGVLPLRVLQPPPWMTTSGQLVPSSIGLPSSEITEGCHLVTPAPGERFDFLTEGDLAAIRPLDTFDDDGLYLLECDDALQVRHISRNAQGKLRIRDERSELDNVLISALPFRVLAQVRVHWRPYAITEEKR
ncbi:helix-turn-helix domain-containing protein [Halomonas sp. HP20-15]|uniref:helix-turn-helix domain-containing protein n=1 Tax=Halomonas sp. HP20-15 TaxID=3085901 RepID=UPI00399130D9